MTQYGADKMNTEKVKKLNIVWVTSEAVPYAKTGGLADVSGALPDALAERGHSVDVIMPWYPQISGNKIQKFDSFSAPLGVPFGNTTEWARIRTLTVRPNLHFHFIEFDKFFDRPRLYDWQGKAYDDNAQRFLFFCRAAMQTVLALGLKVDILHANDWHAALCCLYLRSDLYRFEKSFQNARSVLTIHNLGYQGVFPKENIELTGLGWEWFHYNCIEFYDCLNLLKGGITTAHAVNAVSPTYGREILSPEYGFSLDSALRTCVYEGRLAGILNGIDVKEWNPQTDPLLPANFSADDLSGKKICRRALQKQFGLPVNDNIPLFATISRLAEQKGLDVLCSSLWSLLEQNTDLQCILVGSGNPELENAYSLLQNRFPRNFVFYKGYAPDKISHLVEAGADFFVMPSRYEPCGLNQMYSMRYGTLPIVRSTGGLADTVINYSNSPENNSTGFVFYDLNTIALANTMRWAAEVLKKEPDAFRQMQKNAMTRDFSWNNTAAQYERMYENAFKRV